MFSIPLFLPVMTTTTKRRGSPQGAYSYRVYSTRENLPSLGWPFTLCLLLVLAFTVGAIMYMGSL